MATPDDTPNKSSSWQKYSSRALSSAKGLKNRFSSNGGSGANRGSSALAQKGATVWNFNAFPETDIITTPEVVQMGRIKTRIFAFLVLMSAIGIGVYKGALVQVVEVAIDVNTYADYLVIEEKNPVCPCTTSIMRMNTFVNISDGFVVDPICSIARQLTYEGMNGLMEGAFEGLLPLCTSAVSNINRAREEFNGRFIVSANLMSKGRLTATIKNQYESHVALTKAVFASPLSLKETTDQMQGPISAEQFSFDPEAAGSGRSVDVGEGPRLKIIRSLNVYEVENPTSTDERNPCLTTPALYAVFTAGKEASTATGRRLDEFGGGGMPQGDIFGCGACSADGDCGLTYCQAFSAQRQTVCFNGGCVEQSFKDQMENGGGEPGSAPPGSGPPGSGGSDGAEVSCEQCFNLAATGDCSSGMLSSCTSCCSFVAMMLTGTGPGAGGGSEGRVVCDGYSPGDYCDCSGDCQTRSTTWCGCAEAQACCSGGRRMLQDDMYGTADGSGSGMPPGIPAAPMELISNICDFDVNMQSRVTCESVAAVSDLDAAAKYCSAQAGAPMSWTKGKPFGDTIEAQNYCNEQGARDRFESGNEGSECFYCCAGGFSSDYVQFAGSCSTSSSTNRYLAVGTYKLNTVVTVKNTTCFYAQEATLEQYPGGTSNNRAWGACAAHKLEKSDGTADVLTTDEDGGDPNAKCISPRDGSPTCETLIVMPSALIKSMVEAGQGFLEPLANLEVTGLPPGTTVFLTCDPLKQLRTLDPALLKMPAFTKWLYSYKNLFDVLPSAADPDGNQSATIESYFIPTAATITDQFKNPFDKNATSHYPLSGEPPFLAKSSTHSTLNDALNSGMLIADAKRHTVDHETYFDMCIAGGKITCTYTETRHLNGWELLLVILAFVGGLTTSIKLFVNIAVPPVVRMICKSSFFSGEGSAESKEAKMTPLSELRVSNEVNMMSNPLSPMPNPPAKEPRTAAAHNEL